MDGFIHPVAIAHIQGLQAGKRAAAKLPECPWPIHDYEACLAWFAGYSISTLVQSEHDPILPIQ